MAKLVRIILCGGVILLAPLLLVQGFANARIAPGPLNWNGFWQADVASALVELEQSETSIEFTVNDFGLQLATDAFASEPLATDALFPILIDMRSAGETEQYERLLELALTIDKRNRNLGVLQLERSARAGDYPAVFSEFNRLSVLYPPLVRDFVQPLTALLEEEEAMPILRETLLQDPAWAEAFWDSVPRTRSGLESMYALRQSVDNGPTLRTDARLLSGLATAGLFSEAFALWDEHLATAESSSTAFLNSGDFQPIGWRAVTSGEMSFSARGDGGFDVFVDDRSSGELARQLVRLRPGSYTFSAQMTPITQAANLSVALQCASDEAIAFAPQTLDRSASWTVGSACQYYWLKLSGSAWDARGSVRATISSIELSTAN